MKLYCYFEVISEKNHCSTENWNSDEGFVFRSRKVYHTPKRCSDEMKYACIKLAKVGLCRPFFHLIQWKKKEHFVKLIPSFGQILRAENNLSWLICDTNLHCHTRWSTGSWHECLYCWVRLTYLEIAYLKRKTVISIK